MTFKLLEPNTALKDISVENLQAIVAKLVDFEGAFSGQDPKEIEQSELYDWWISKGGSETNWQELDGGKFKPKETDGEEVDESDGASAF